MCEVTLPELFSPSGRQNKTNLPLMTFTNKVQRSNVLLIIRLSLFQKNIYLSLKTVPLTSHTVSVLHLHYHYPKGDYYYLLKHLSITPLALSFAFLFPVEVNPRRLTLSDHKCSRSAFITVVAGLPY